MTFQVHQQLAADFHPMLDLHACHILLRRNALIPWYIIVPETTVSELDRLKPELRRTVESLSDQLARFIRAEHGSERVNIAAIGNIVPQLHLHVTGRRTGDACWPGVVWGQLPEGPDWSEPELAKLRLELAQALTGD
ncbi:HIT family protein [Methylonatrum kenyense]|uniref:HIT family protein n=1 Tax=Methylonatrum kenyense TaxID=455253 RepID=UPI0020C0B3CB|nr:HIT family protein [Methylonatrum kenyense]MCK8515727.1 HIT family protein [Methylonatrum kenyense]